MKRFRNTTIVLALASMTLMGCGRPTQSRPGQWFENATGLPLPAGVQELNAQVIVVLMVGDTYYLKLKDKGDLKTLLDEEFERCAWSDAKQHMVPPEDWMPDLPFWDKEAVAGAELYRRRRTDKGGTGWLAYAAYLPEQGLCYFAGIQTGG